MDKTYSVNSRPKATSMYVSAYKEGDGNKRRKGGARGEERGEVYQQHAQHVRALSQFMVCTVQTMTTAMVYRKANDGQQEGQYDGDK